MLSYISSSLFRKARFPYFHAFGLILLFTFYISVNGYSETRLGTGDTPGASLNLKRIKLVGEIIENRFVATGVIIDIKRTTEGPQRFVMHIKEIESIGDFANYGEGYLDKSVEILSEIGIPSSFRPGLEVSLVLRVSGDEWGQYLFLVEVVNNAKTKQI